MKQMENDKIKFFLGNRYLGELPAKVGDKVRVTIETVEEEGHWIPLEQGDTIPAYSDFVENGKVYEYWDAEHDTDAVAQFAVAYWSIPKQKHTHPYVPVVEPVTEQTPSTDALEARIAALELQLDGLVAWRKRAFMIGDEG